LSYIYRRSLGDKQQNDSCFDGLHTDLLLLLLLLLTKSLFIVLQYASLCGAVDGGDNVQLN